MSISTPYLHSATSPDTAVNAKNMDNGMDERVLNFEDEYFQMTFSEVFCPKSDKIRIMFSEARGQKFLKQTHSKRRSGTPSEILKNKMTAIR